MDTGLVESILGEMFAEDAAHGHSLAALATIDGEVVLERYGVHPDTAFGPGEPVTADSTLISWSMAKSITHAAVGILVDGGHLDLSAPAPVPSWAGTDKERITLQQLLDMRSGLLFVEDYVDGGVSHVIDMLFGSGQDDVAAYAAALPLEHEPGSTWNYSSGTTNIVARIVGDVVGGGRDGMESFLRDRVFAPAGMHSAIPKFDAAGTFVGSSFVYATARDFARFGELYRRDGLGPDGQRVLPAGWAEHARTLSASDPETGFEYGAHWWMWPRFPGSLACHGYEGQFTLVVPDRGLVLVHLGKVPAERRPLLTAHVTALVEAVCPD